MNKIKEETMFLAHKILTDDSYTVKKIPLDKLAEIGEEGERLVRQVRKGALNVARTILQEVFPNLEIVAKIECVSSDMEKIKIKGVDYDFVDLEAQIEKWIWHGYDHENKILYIFHEEFDLSLFCKYERYGVF